MLTEDDVRGAAEGTLFLSLQKRTVEALLKEHSFLVLTEDDGRGAAEGTFFP